MRRPRVARLISLFRSCKAVKPHDAMTKEAFLAAVKSGRWSAEVGQCRSALIDGGEEAYREARKTLPAVTLSARTETRAREVLEDQRGAVHTGLLQGDFDAKHHPGKTKSEILSEVIAGPFVEAAFLSLSGEGVKAIIRIPPSFETHKASWRAAAAYFRERGLIMDPATCDPFHLCFVSDDSNLSQRHDAQEIEPQAECENETDSESEDQGSVRVEHARAVLAELAEKLDRPDYPDWIRIASATFHGVGVEAGVELLGDAFPEEQRGEYRKLAKSMRYFIPWGTLFSYGVNPTDPAEYFDDLTEVDDPSAEAKKSDAFPPIRTGAELRRLFPDPPPDVIRGVLGEREKLMVAGASKAGKTFALLALAAAVANGGTWLGFECVRGEVLFVNFEISESRMSQRIKRIEGADKIHFLNLRAFRVGWRKLRAELTRMGGSYKLIIIDPIYKMLHGKSENDNGEIADLLFEVETLATSLGSAVAFGHHFSKGSKANTSQIDRASGAGSWSRDPDAIVTLTDQETAGSFTVEATLRNYKAPPPTVWRFAFPNFELVEGGDPEALRGKSRKDKIGSAQTVFEILAEGPLPKSEIVAALVEKLGCSTKTADRRLKEAEAHLSRLPDGTYSLPTDI